MPEAPVHINLEPSTNAPYSKGALEPRNMVGLGGFEPPTSPLSGVRSNQLSYRPDYQSETLRPRIIRRTKLFTISRSEESLWT